jgi:hypothetical protein
MNNLNTNIFFCNFYILFLLFAVLEARDINLGERDTFFGRINIFLNRYNQERRESDDSSDESIPGPQVAELQIAGALGVFHDLLRSREDLINNFTKSIEARLYVYCSNSYTEFLDTMNLTKKLVKIAYRNIDTRINIHGYIMRCLENLIYIYIIL